MKRLYSLIGALIITSSAFSQIKYDDGPIITSGNFVVSGTWGRNNITFSFQNGTNDIAGNDEQNAIRQAFQIWADYANLNFTEVTANADIVVLWGVGNHGDGFPFDGVNGVLAHAFFPPPDGGIFAGDIHFDDDEQWTLDERPIPSGQPIDLVTVAAHEIGHALGLGHSNVNCALMNPFYTGSHRYLAQDDIDGIRTIYGNRSPILTSNVSCNGGTYSIRNIPTGGILNWISSNTNIATVNNQGVVSWTGSNSGNIVLTARLTLPCGIIINENIPVNNLGVPAAPSISPYNFDNNCGTFFEAYSSRPGGTDSYLWNLNFGQVVQENPGYYGNYFYTAPLINNPIPGQYYYNYLTVQARNTCGLSTPSETLQFTVGPIASNCDGGGGGPILLRVSPNPTSGSLMVESKDGKMFSQLKIIDRMGNMKKLISLAPTTRATININELPADIYRIQALINNNWRTATFIKQ